MSLAALSGRRCDVEISGDWEQPELVVLAACFALLALRRRFIIIVSGGTH